MLVMQGYFSLTDERRRMLLLTLAREYDLNRGQVRELMKQYLALELPSSKFQDFSLFHLFIMILGLGYTFVE